jgi:carboxyl-terminal processing protease
MRSRAILVAAILAGATVTGGWLVQRGLHGQPDAFYGARLFDAVMTHVTRYYVDTLDEQQLYRKAVDGMLDELNDPHSVFLTPERLAALTENTTGTYAGLGVQIDVRDGWVTVISPLPGTPAEKAGLETGDRIIEIEGQSTQQWTVDEATKALRGPAGATVSVTVERPGMDGRIPFRIQRQEIVVRAVQNVQLLRPGVGYLDLNVFSETTTDEVRGAVDSLVALGAKSVVIDLRGNPGGLLDQGVGMSDLFLDPGQQIVSMRGRIRESNRVFVDSEPQRWANMPLVVLVDGGSASASEIVAGALQDHDRAVLVGNVTYGKGSAQSLFPMANGGALKLTTALWYTPSGRSINKPVGVNADEEEGEPGAPEEEPVRKPYRTDAGRTVYDGGGIVPDLAVGDTAPTPAERDFEQALDGQLPQFRSALADYAVSLKVSRAVTDPDFTVTPAMREALWQRMQQRKITVPRGTYDAATPLVDRVLANEVARYVFGPKVQFRQQARHDETIAAALQLADGAGSPKALFERAERMQQQKGSQSQR